VSSKSSQQAIDEQLTQLRDVNAPVHAEVERVLPVIRPHGDEAELAWVLACRRLHDYDREAGRAFVQGSVEAERISETVVPWTRQALQFLRWRGAWRVLEGFMHNLPRAYGSLGHAGQERWAEIGFTWCARQVESGYAYFSTPVVDLSGRQGITGIEQLMLPAEELFESRKLLLSTCLGGAIRVRNLLGAQAILPWATRGADILQAARARGEAYFRLESEESLALLLDQLPGFRLVERNRLLSMLLDVWYGQGFDMKEGSWSPEKGRPFFETDGRSLYFPAIMPNRDEAVLSLLHTAGHMRFGTFDRAAMKALFGEAGVEFPESGPVSWATLYARYGDDALRFQLIFDLCEDLRVDFRVQQLVPNYLQRMLATAPSGARHHDTAAYYAMAVKSVEQALATSQGAGAAGDPRLATLLKPSATVADAWRVASAIHEQDGLPPVSDLDAFHAAYLPGRAPNTSRLAHPQQQDQQQQQTQSGAEGEQQPQEEDGEEQEQNADNAENGDQRDGGKRQEITGFGDTAGATSRAAGRSEHGLVRQGRAVS
jgi:nitric oxide reductase NorD protein